MPNANAKGQCHVPNAQKAERKSLNPKFQIRKNAGACMHDSVCICYSLYVVLTRESQNEFKANRFDVTTGHCGGKAWDFKFEQGWEGGEGLDESTLHCAAVKTCATTTGYRNGNVNKHRNACCVLLDC